MRTKVMAVVLCCALLVPTLATAGTITTSYSCTNGTCTGSFSNGTYSGTGTISSTGGSGSLYYLGNLLFSFTFSFFFH